MTALCGGGSSAPKAGVAETIIFTTSSLASLLNNRGGLWATVAAPLLGVLTYSATNLCSSDPPAEPTLTAEEYTALLNLAPWDTLMSALAKLRDLATIAIWFEMCACTSVATPAAPTDLWTPPTGVTLPSYDTNCPQPRARLAAGYKPSVGQWQAPTNITRTLYPDLPVLQSTANANAAAQDIAPWPNNWLGLAATVDLVSGSVTAPQGVGVFYLAYLPDRTYSGNAYVGTSVTSAAPHNRSPSSGTTTIDKATYPYFAVQLVQSAGASSQVVVDLAIETNCAGAAAPSSCCPPDPAAIAMLQQLLQLVTLEQRYRLPFATVDGDTHLAILEDSFSVERAVGLKIDVLVIPPGKRTSMGNPDYVFDLGWISVTDGAGMLQELRITRAHHTWFPSQMQLATSVGYALQPGVEASITELRPES